MPTIKLTDQLGLNVEIQPNPASAIGKYFRSIPALLIQGKGINDIAGLTLSDPAVTSLQTGLDFQNPVPIGTTDVELTIGAGLNGSLGIFVPDPHLKPGETDSLFGSDDFEDDVPVAPTERYVSFGFTASLGSDVSVGVSDLTFGFSANSSVSLVNYRKFSVASNPPTVLQAFQSTIQGFQIPGDIEDLDSLVLDGVITATGNGALRFSATANLLSAVNPLAAAQLPSPLPSIAVKGGASVTVGAAFQLFGDYQIRVQKIAPGRIRLGYFKEAGTQVSVKAEASAGVSTTLGSTDLFSTVISAVSAGAAADFNELQQAGLDEGKIASLQAAVKAGIERSLEVALSFELGSLASRSAAFLYEVDLTALDAAGRAALHKALDGDLSDLVSKEENLPPGIKLVRSIFTNLRQQKHVLKINLLGIYNFISIAKLTLSGEMLYDPESGALTLTDTATANKIRASVVNVGGQPFSGVADPGQLRSVLSAAFLITAAYRASKSLVNPPELSCRHSFFQLHNQTNTETMRDELDTAVGLGLLTAAERDSMLQGIGEFGRTTAYATTAYDDALTTAFFLNNGNPRPVEDYDSIGRAAMQILIHDGDQDASRLVPLRNDALWAKMKTQGQPNFKLLFPQLNGPQLAAVTADYTLIRWWADAMQATAAKLAEVRRFLESSANPDVENHRFKALRADLAAHLESVAANTKDEFGRPWGLIAMDLLSGSKSEASVMYTGRAITLAKRRPHTLAASGQGR